MIDLVAIYRDDRLAEAKAYLLGMGFGRQGPEFARPWPEERPMYLGTYRCGEAFLIYIHVGHHASPEIPRFRSFRERLLGNPALLAGYCAKKRAIIARGVTDTDEYRIRKRAVIHRILDAGISPEPITAPLGVRPSFDREQGGYLRRSIRSAQAMKYFMLE